MDRYVISVEGLIPDGAMAGIYGFKAIPQPLHTVLQGELPDQSALAGVLDHLDELGIVILEVITLPSEADDQPEPMPGPDR